MQRFFYKWVFIIFLSCGKDCETKTTVKLDPWKDNPKYISINYTMINTTPQTNGTPWYSATLKHFVGVAIMHDSIEFKKIFGIYPSKNIDFINYSLFYYYKLASIDVQDYTLLKLYVNPFNKTIAIFIGGNSTYSTCDGGNGARWIYVECLIPKLMDDYKIEIE